MAPLAQKLRVTSLNVWGLPEPFAKDVRPRLAGIAWQLARIDSDVVALQEVWTEEGRSILAEGARRAGFEVVTGSEQRPGGGLLMLSRAGIVRSRFETFRFRGDPEDVGQAEYLGGKGFLELEIETPSGPVTLIDTHLHASYRRARPRLDGAVHSAQLLQLAERLLQIDHPVLLVGDFNFRDSDPEYGVIVGLTRVRDVAAALGQRSATISRDNHYKRNRSGPDSRIDYVFSRDAGQLGWRPLATGRCFDQPLALKRKLRPASDHFGIWAELALETRASAARARPSASAVDLARRLVVLGREEAERRARSQQNGAGLWLGAATLALGTARSAPLSRRRFLRGAVLGGAGLALAPAIGLATLAHVDSPRQVEAYRRAEQTLARFERLAGA